MKFLKEYWPVILCVILILYIGMGGCDRAETKPTEIKKVQQASKQIEKQRVEVGKKMESQSIKVQVKKKRWQQVKEKHLPETPVLEDKKDSTSHEAKKELVSACDSLNQAKDSLLATKDKEIILCDSLRILEVTGLKQELKEAKEEIVDLKKQLRKEKRKKVLAAILGLAGIGVLVAR